LLLQSLPFTGTPTTIVGFQSHDDAITVDYVKVSKRASVPAPVVFEDNFTGTAGPLDAAKWTYTGTGSAVLDGFGYAVLTPASPWGGFLSIAASATTWQLSNLPVFETGVIFQTPDGAPDQVFFGFGLNPMYANHQAFHIQDDGSLWVQWLPGPGTSTGVTVVRDGVTPQFFRISLNADGTADYEYKNGNAGNWQLLLQSLPFTGTPTVTVGFQSNDDPIKIDYVKVSKRVPVP
jgi:hypothetical protein